MYFLRKVVQKGYDSVIPLVMHIFLKVSTELILEYVFLLFNEVYFVQAYDLFFFSLVYTTP